MEILSILLIVQSMVIVVMYLKNKKVKKLLTDTIEFLYIESGDYSNGNIDNGFDEGQVMSNAIISDFFGRYDKIYKTKLMINHI